MIDWTKRWFGIITLRLAFDLLAIGIARKGSTTGKRCYDVQNSKKIWYMVYTVQKSTRTVNKMQRGWEPTKNNK